MPMADFRGKLDHCVIHVTDWSRSNAFDRDVLGAELIDRGNGTWAYFRDPDGSVREFISYAP